MDINKKNIDVDECELNIDNCDENMVCINIPGSFSCSCNLGYYGTACSPCPENSTSLFGSVSILDCKCELFNHYPDHQTSTCLPCPLGFLLDASNTCQSN